LFWLRVFALIVLPLSVWSVIGGLLTWWRVKP